LLLYLTTRITEFAIDANINYIHEFNLKIIINYLRNPQRSLRYERYQ